MLKRPVGDYLVELVKIDVDNVFWDNDSTISISRMMLGNFVHASI